MLWYIISIHYMRIWAFICTLEERIPRTCAQSKFIWHKNHLIVWSNLDSSLIMVQNGRVWCNIVQGRCRNGSSKRLHKSPSFSERALSPYKRMPENWSSPAEEFTLLLKTFSKKYSLVALGYSTRKWVSIDAASMSNICPKFFKVFLVKYT